MMEKNYFLGLISIYIVLLIGKCASSRYDGYKILRIGPLRDVNEVNNVKQLLDWKTRQVIPLIDEHISVGNTASLLVSPEQLRSVRQALRGHRIPYVIGQYTGKGSKNSTDITEDVEIDSLSALQKSAQSLLHESLEQKQPDHTSYLTFDEQYSWLQQKVASSSVTQMYSLTSTHEGRDMPCVLINYNQYEKPIIWIDANLRAGDWITSGVALYLIDQILNGQSDDPVFLRSNFRIMIVPNANPDGYEYSRTVDRLWVKNRNPNSQTESTSCVGTDITKNFAVNFGVDGSSDDPCDDRYHGPYQHSEVETYAIETVLGDYKEHIKLYISLQAYGQQWLLPYAYTMNHPNDYQELERVANMSVRSMQLPSGTKYEVGAESDFTGKVSGKSNDYAKIYCNIVYSYTIKLRPETVAEGGMNIPASQIIPNGQEVLAGIGEACREANFLKN